MADRPSEPQTSPEPPAEPTPPAPAPMPTTTTESQRLASLEERLNLLTQENQRLAALVPEVNRLTADNTRLLAADRISGLGTRLTPAMQDRLLPLLMATQGQTVTLTSKGTPQKVTLWDAITSVLEGLPEMSFITAGQLAVDDPDSPLAGELASSGLPPERLQELDRRFKFTQSPSFRR